jgi:hypothetical protein
MCDESKGIVDPKVMINQRFYDAYEKKKVVEVTNVYWILMKSWRTE